MYQNKKVALILDGENLGQVSSIDTNIEEVDYFDDMLFISKKYITNFSYMISCPGVELVCRKFLTTQLENEHKIFISGDDVLEARFYPYENNEAFENIFNKVSQAKIPYTVYNEGNAYLNPMYGAPFEDRSDQEKLLKLLPGLMKDVVCPQCHADDSHEHEESSVWEIVQRLNDSHKWSREQIADWLETLDIDITFPIGEENDKVG